MIDGCLRLRSVNVSTNSTSNSLSGCLKELTNSKKPLGNSKSCRGRFREHSLMGAFNNWSLIRGVWVKVKTGFHSVSHN